jgi:cell division protease FtsH
MAKNMLIWAVIAVVLIFVFSNFNPDSAKQQSYSYSQFLKEVDGGNIKNITITNDNQISGTTASNQKFSTFIPYPDQYLMTDLLKHNVEIVGKPPEEQSIWLRILISWFPFILLIGIWLFFMRQMQGGGSKGGVMGFGRSRAKLLSQDQVRVTFKDVAGCDEAKEEVTEIVDFLKDPSKFQKLGGMIPKGVLLVGPPGTGKTLLAKAVAGEAKVPFFTISGSDFVEMFVGVGASRVRDMFAQAKKQAPCIIFIDEIDAVGRHRGAGLGGGHDEREQTLNQMLVEMDGFEGKEGVIVVAATNRPDVLDPALLRPGRFDRQVVVGLPDIKGREEILNVHMKKVPLANDVEALTIARGTPGFSGADLANLVNEAALFAARSDKRTVDMHDFEMAKDKIMMGAERRSMVMDDNEKKLTAYHEAGHAIIGCLMPDHDPVHKVTIIPRGRALGVTMFLPEQDRYSYSLQRLESQLCSLYGGRLAEELIFGIEKVTTGASNDIERATSIARNMVTKWGLSQKLGPMTYGENEDEVFLGRQVSRQQEISDNTAHEIDKEVRGIVEKNYSHAQQILKDNIDILHAMADTLIKYETIDKQQIKNLMDRKPAGEPKGWDGTKTTAKTDANSSDEKKAQDTATESETKTSTDAEQLEQDKSDSSNS